MDCQDKLEGHRLFVNLLYLDFDLLKCFGATKFNDLVKRKSLSRANHKTGSNLRFLDDSEAVRDILCTQTENRKWREMAESLASPWPSCALLWRCVEPRDNARLKNLADPEKSVLRPGLLTHKDVIS